MFPMIILTDGYIYNRMDEWMKGMDGWKEGMGGRKVWMEGSKDDVSNTYVEASTHWRTNRPNYGCIGRWEWMEWWDEWNKGMKSIGEWHLIKYTLHLFIIFFFIHFLFNIHFTSRHHTTWTHVSYMHQNHNIYYDVVKVMIIHVNDYGWELIIYVIG